MLGHNVAILDFIFDCILPLMPFPSGFKGGNTRISLLPV